MCFFYNLLKSIRVSLNAHIFKTNYAANSHTLNSTWVSTSTAYVGLYVFKINTIANIANPHPIKWLGTGGDRCSLCVHNSASDDDNAFGRCEQHTNNVIIRSALQFDSCNGSKYVLLMRRPSQNAFIQKLKFVNSHYGRKIWSNWSKSRHTIQITRMY